MDPGLIVSFTRRTSPPDARSKAAHSPSGPPAPPIAHESGVAPLIYEITTDGGGEGFGSVFLKVRKVHQSHKCFVKHTVVVL